MCRLRKSWREATAEEWSADRYFTTGKNTQKDPIEWVVLQTFPPTQHHTHKQSQAHVDPHAHARRMHTRPRTCTRTHTHTHTYTRAHSSAQGTPCTDHCLLPWYILKNFRQVVEGEVERERDGGRGGVREKKERWSES